MVDMSTFMDAHEIIEITGMSEAYAYKLIKQLNKELEEKALLQFVVVLADSILKKEFME